MQVFARRDAWNLPGIAFLFAIGFGSNWYNHHASSVAGSRPISYFAQALAIFLPLSIGLALGWFGWTSVSEDHLYLPPIGRLALFLAATLALFHFAILPALGDGMIKFGSIGHTTKMTCRQGDRFVDRHDVPHVESEHLAYVGTSPGNSWRVYLWYSFVLVCFSFYVGESLRHVVQSDDSA